MTLSRRLARPLLSSVFISGGLNGLQNAQSKVGAGLLLAIGKAPRLASLVLIGSMVPTTVAGHRFWEENEPQAKGQQQVHFFKNLSLIGGLLIAAVDTGGKPSLGYRARRRASQAGSRATSILP